MKRDALLRKLGSMGACEEAMVWLKDTKPATLREAWNTCQRADWMLWLLIKLHPGVEGPIRHAICDCAETALRFVPAGEDRPQRAIEIARAYADGRATAHDLAAARAAAEAAAGDAAWAAAWDAARAAAHKHMAALVRKRVPNPEVVR